MATFVHNKPRAKKSRDWIEETSRNNAECCIALAFIGKADQPVALVMPAGLNGLSNKLKNMNYEGKPDKIDVKKDKDFKLVALGLVRLDQEGVLNVRLKKGSAKSLGKGLKEYFKDGFGIPVPYNSIAPEVALPEDQENLFAQTEAENQQKFSSEEGESAQQASTAEQPRPAVGGDADSDSDGSPILTTPQASEAEPAGVPAEGLLSDQALPEETNQEIASIARLIADHTLKASGQTGVGQHAESDPIFGKVADGLAKRLANIDAADREAALYDMKCAILIALAYAENLRNLQYVDGSSRKKADRWKRHEANASDAAGDEPLEPLMVNGIDIDEMPDLDQAKLTEILFDAARKEAERLSSSYDVENVNDRNISELVSTGWPKGETHPKAMAAFIQRLINVTQSQFEKDAFLIRMLDLKPLGEAGAAREPTAEEKAAIAELVESIRAGWEAARSSALQQKDDIKKKVEDMIGTKVENLGGTWKHVDDIFLQIDDEISDQLMAIVGQQGKKARSQAIEAAKGTVKTNLDYLGNNGIVDLLDQAEQRGIGPFAVGEALRNGLASVGDGLKRIESLDVQAVA
ncbi:MAG: hypothetical protein ACRC67_23280 [Inquilinus sp.]|uniref:hypothetical protein n=1 Tax=Inquilinus sp. TaxID=1932117 RepID=UPI003F314AB1